MRKNLVIIGLVLLIIGVAMLFGGASLLAPKININSAPVSEVSLGNNLWKSPAIQVNGTNYILTDKSSSSKVYLVPSADISMINSTNLAQYGISPLSHTSVSSNYILTYNVASAGTYYLITVSSTSPTNSYSVLDSSSLISTAIVSLLGLVVGFVGFIILIVGLFLKKKQPQNPEQY